MMRGNGVTHCAFLWTMFAISLLFGGAYALLFDHVLSASVRHALMVVIP